MNNCFECKHFEHGYEYGNSCDLEPRWEPPYCNKRPGNSNLINFPFARTSCKVFEQKEKNNEK